MCVVSMVHDFYDPRFRPYLPIIPLVDPFIQPQLQLDAEAIKKMIEDYHKAMEAAKTVDKLTAQPDCEDPEKAKLKERVAELEAKIAAIQKAIGPP